MGWQVAAALPLAFVLSSWSAVKSEVIHLMKSSQAFKIQCFDECVVAAAGVKTPAAGAETIREGSGVEWIRVVFKIQLI